MGRGEERGTDVMGPSLRRLHPTGPRVVVPPVDATDRKRRGSGIRIVNREMRYGVMLSSQTTDGAGFRGERHADAGAGGCPGPALYRVSRRRLHTDQRRGVRPTGDHSRWRSRRRSTDGATARERHVTPRHCDPRCSPAPGASNGRVPDHARPAAGDDPGVSRRNPRRVARRGIRGRTPARAGPVAFLGRKPFV